MMFNQINPYQRDAFYDHSFLDSLLHSNDNSPPVGFYQASPSSIDYVVGLSDQHSEDNDRQITAAIAAVQQDPLSRFLNSKKESLANITKGIVDQIHERVDIRDHNFYEIDERVNRVNGFLETLRIFYIGTNPAIDKRKAILERELIAFEQERRFESVSCWRDISRLKLQIAEVGQQIDNQLSRERLIEG